VLYTHPYCKDNEIDKGYRIMKQPFHCTDVSLADLNSKVFPVFQTVRCVGLSDDSVLSGDVAVNEYDQFYGPGAGADDDGSSDEGDSSTADDDEWYWKN